MKKTHGPDRIRQGTIHRYKMTVDHESGERCVNTHICSFAVIRDMAKTFRGLSYVKDVRVDDLGIEYIDS